jgi:uncharacterized lipoprotein YmbA
MALTLSACGSDDLFLVSTPPVADQVQVYPRSIEVQDVVLPAYAAEADILVQEEDGALRPLGGALWADDPQLGITQALARRLDLGTTATVAPEPWPLFDGPDRRIQVTIDRMVARASGEVELGGQFAVTSPSGAAREYLRRFDIRQPLAGTEPQQVAEALGRALAVLSDQIAASLAR